MKLIGPLVLCVGQIAGTYVLGVPIQLPLWRWLIGLGLIAVGDLVWWVMRGAT